MTVLFNQHWDIRPGKEQAYTDFVMTYYSPTLEKCGVRLVGGYNVVVGKGPGIIAVGLARNMHDLELALSSMQLEEITDRLLELVTGYESQILIPTEKLTADGDPVQTGLWKFHQCWNIAADLAPGRYADFVTTQLLPTLRRAGLTVSGAWRVIAGSGPSTLTECSAPRLLDIARAIDSEEFRHVTHVLTSSYVTDYHSRILAPTGRVEVPILVKAMMAEF